MTKGRLGTIIRSAREEKEWDQKDLSQKVGKTTSAVSQIESGNLIPSEKLLGLICKLLDLDYRHAWLIAQAEKARSGMARQTSVANLKNYESQFNEAAKTRESTPEPVAPNGPNQNQDAFLRVPQAHLYLDYKTARLESNNQESGWFAFNKKWLDNFGGPEGKIMLKAVGNSMSPVIEDGDVVLIDQSEMARQIKPGRIYAVYGEEPVTIKRVYFGAKPNHLILASENNREFPDLEIEVPVGKTSPIIGRVIWLGREMIL